MIEIVCPSCGAHYQVPDESIGPEGRNVTCSACSHKWRAYREAPAETVEAAESPAATAEPEAAAAPPPASGREEQMDTIRRMLEELKRTEESGPDPESAAAAPRPSRPEQAARRRDENESVEEEPEADPLKARISRLTSDGKPAKEAGRMANYDAARLRKKHERRARQLQRAKERKRRSGAFVTGFTLVAAVAATMAGLYVLRPQIVASSPEMGPAMDQYVVTVDRYRIALDEATAGWQAWIAEQIARFGGGEQEGAAAPAAPAQN